MLSAFVISIVTILLLTRIISVKAGLPILAGIGGFAIGRGVLLPRACSPDDQSLKGGRANSTS